MNPPVFEEEGLILRPLTIADAPALHAAHADPAVHHFWSGPAHATLDETERYLAATLDIPGAEVWAITPDAGEALGRVALFTLREGVGEFGVVLRADAQGRGLVSRAIRRIARYAFETRGLHRLVADIDPDNVASIRAFERAGFACEARLKANWMTHLGIRDSLIFALLKPGL